MSRGPQYSDKKEKYYNANQYKNTSQSQKKSVLDKLPLGYRKVTTSTGLTSSKNRAKNVARQDQDLYGRDYVNPLKAAAEGGAQARSKTQMRTEKHQYYQNNRRLEEFRALIGDFDVEDSYHVLRDQPIPLNTNFQPVAGDANPRDSNKQQKSISETQPHEADQSRLTEPQAIMDSPGGEDKPLVAAAAADKTQEALQDVSSKHSSAVLHQRNLHNVYHAIEEQFLTKQRKSTTRDWIAKNKNEKPQSFGSFKRHQKNWTIDQIIILEMWDEESQVPTGHSSQTVVDQEQVALATEQEGSFQKMLVNNMDAVFKLFFTGMSVLRVKRKRPSANDNQDGSPSKKAKYDHIEQNLSELERQGVVETRVRKDTGVKQFHAGQIFEYLKDNMLLKHNQCLLVLTNADLYPKDGWTFVFGMTKQSWRICIQSYARHHPNFASHTDQPSRMFDSKVAKLVQYRAIKTACHELCHVLSMRHCQAYECLMNGSSQLDEADQKPFALCPVCLRKLSYYLDFEGAELQRYKKMREVVKIMNHKDPNQCYQREIVLFGNIINALTEVARQAQLPLPRSSASCAVSDKEGGTYEHMKRMDKKLLAIQQANQEAGQLSDGFSSEQLTHQPLSSARARPYTNDGCSSEISIQELQVLRMHEERRLVDLSHGYNGEKPTIVQKMCQYICCCFSCLQRPDESKNEYTHEQLSQMVAQQDQRAQQSVPGRHRVPQGASQVANKRSQKQQFKQAQVNYVAERQNTGPHTEDGEAQPMGRQAHNDNRGGVVRAADPMIFAEGRNIQKVDLESGEQRKEQKKIPRIYDVDESMSLQKMTTKANPGKRDRSQNNGQAIRQ